MAVIVVPFRSRAAKVRLAPLPDYERRELALAMLGDVVTASSAVGKVTVVTDDPQAAGAVAARDAQVVLEEGADQGTAVAGALRGLAPGPILVVNADLPCVVPRDLRSLLRATPAGGVALVAAADGTTNALSLSAPELFAPLYGRDSASRFRAHAARNGVEAVDVVIPNLAEDVDTVADLRRLGLRAGPRTQAAVSRLGIAA